MTAGANGAPRVGPAVRALECVGVPHRPPGCLVALSERNWGGGGRRLDLLSENELYSYIVELGERLEIHELAFCARHAA